MNVDHFQLSMLAYNLNCWLALFDREETAKVADLTHRTMATTRLRILYLAARIWRHAGQTGNSYGSHYQERRLRFAGGTATGLSCPFHYANRDLRKGLNGTEIRSSGAENPLFKSVENRDGAMHQQRGNGSPLLCII